MSLRSGEMEMSEISSSLQFWILLIFTIPSLICSLFVIYRYLSNHILRNGLHNHSILLLVIINVILISTDVSWILDNLRRGGKVLSRTPSFCLLWWIIDDSFYGLQTAILAWASIERHILIFHSKYVSTRKQKLIYRCLPPSLLTIYVFLFYIGVIVYAPCENHFEYHQLECGSSPCYLNLTFLSTWDLIVNNIIPTLIIAICNLALLYRIIAQKQRLRQPIDWRKHRRMSMQLLSLSAVYLFLNLPMIVVMLIQLTQSRDPQVGFGTQLYIFILTYSVTLSLPFVVCLNRLSIDKRRLVQISPTVAPMGMNKTSVAREIPTIA